MRQIGGKKKRNLLLAPASVHLFEEPHEICEEQNAGEVVWRRTPAGDEAATACPADASGTETWLFFPNLSPIGEAEKFVFNPPYSSTGLILRRCSLDGVGLASWEDPTHVKCISKNYENIQTLVRKCASCFMILLLGLFFFPPRD